MCGINGVFHYAGGAADPGFIERQAALMRHRGPDGAGVWSEGPVALGHRRLAIVDLSEGGRQPMANEDESLWVTYNGELYGWPEMRAELASRGHRFRGTSDTEAILHLYEELGDGMLERLRGMFAFALYDRRRSRLLIARDRLGIKPLYYHDDGRRLAFASELKALLADASVPREIDPAAVADFLTFQYVPSPRSIWKGIRKLPPGHTLVCDAGGVRVERYWQLPVEPEPGHPAEWYRERLRALLTEAVRIRLVADVPLGAFLSGGIDSSAIVALMAQAVPEPIRTFSVGFEEQDFSELEHARRVARHLGTDHHEFVVRPHALELLPRLVWGMDEPFADPSMIPTWYVSEAARRQVVVALSGDGGDEAFGGYDTYAWARQYAGLDRIPRPLRQAAALGAGWLHADHPLGRKLHRGALRPVDRHLEVMSYFPPRDLAHVLSGSMRGAMAGHDPYAAPRKLHAHAAAAAGDVPGLLYLDAMTYMVDDVLTKVDRTSMMHSLEVRVPLLDHKVLEFVARIPFEYKLRGDTRKWILREAVKDLLPPETLARPKMGFGVPLHRWLGVGFDALAREVLLDPAARRRDWLDPDGVRAVLDDRAGRDTRRARQVWALVCLELWAQTYADRPREALGAPAESLVVARTSPAPGAGSTAAA